MPEFTGNVKRMIITFNCLGGVGLALQQQACNLQIPVTAGKVQRRPTRCFLVWVGLMLNIWVIIFIWMGGALPPKPVIDFSSGLPPTDAYDFAFYRIRFLTMGAVLGSMIAYMAAQFCDVALFHFWKRLTRGRHLWLRNNGSTLVSQFVDSFAVITITHFYAHGIPLDPNAPIWPQLAVFIASGYVFKMVIALLDTPVFYVGVHYLSRYLEIDPIAEHGQGDDY